MKTKEEILEEWFGKEDIEGSFLDLISLAQQAERERCVNICYKHGRSIIEHGCEFKSDAVRAAEEISKPAEGGK